MITKETLLKIAKLSHLTVEEHEIEEFRSNLSSVFEYMTDLESVETNSVSAMSHVQNLSNVFREDKVEQVVSPEEVLAAAPDSSGRFIRVPIIIEPGTEH